MKVYLVLAINHNSEIDIESAWNTAEKAQAELKLLTHAKDNVRGLDTASYMGTSHFVITPIEVQ